MTPDAILLALQQAGITVAARDGRLHLEGSAALLKSGLLGEAREHREALLGLLGDRDMVDRIAAETGCNSATVAIITGQVPEKNGHAPTVAVPVAGLLQFTGSATVQRGDKASSACDTAIRSDNSTVAVAVDCNSPATATATAITGQVPEKNSRTLADCCTVAVDSAGYGDAYVDDGFTSSANPALAALVAERLYLTLAARGVVFTADDGQLRYTAPAGAMSAVEIDAVRSHRAELLALVHADAVTALDVATAEYEHLWHEWMALDDAGHHAEARALRQGPYFAAGEHMAALLPADD